MKHKLFSVFTDRLIRAVTTSIAILLMAAIPTQAVFASQALGSVAVGAQTGTLTYGTSASATYTITVHCTGSGNTNNSVTVALGISGLPTGVSSSFAPSSLTFSKNTCPADLLSQLTLTTSSTNVPGSTSFTVTGTPGTGTPQSGTGTLLIGTRPITVTAQSNTKFYDGTTSAAAIPLLTSGTLATGDVGTYTEAYSSAGAGTGKTLIPSAVILNGATDVTTRYNISLVNDASGVINKTDPVLTVSNSPVTYDGVAKSAQVNASVPGNITSILSGGLPTQTNAGTYAVTADFVPNDTANYNSLTGASAGNFIINKATPVLSVSSPAVTYNGAPHFASVSCAVAGSITNVVTGGAPTQTHAGTYAVTANFAPTDTTNYNSLTNATAQGSYVINKADATISVTPYSVTYNGLPHTATATVYGVLSEPLSGIVLTGTTHTNVGDYPGDAWTFTDATGNYNNASGTVHDVITKANASIVPTAYNVTYDGAPHSATGTATGAQGESLSGLIFNSTHTNAGDYPLDSWTFTDVTGNYNNASGTVHNVIAKANATISVTPYSVTYDHAAHTATGTATGVLAEPLSGLALAGTTHTNAGDYASDAWTFTDSTGNYNNAAGTVHDVIAKADASCSINGYTGVYDGNAHAASGACAGVDAENPGTLDLGASYTNAPGGTAHWSLTGNINYSSQSGDVAIALSKANANITVNGYTGTYDGSAHGATGTALGVEAAPANLNSLLHLGSTFANVPGGTAHWTFDGNTNYNATSGDVAVTLGKADATVAVTPYSVTYDGTAHTATGTAKGVQNETLAGLALTSTAHTNAGDYPVDAWTFTDGTGNYNNASGTVHDSISKAAASITVTPYGATYDGSVHTATGTAKGVLNEDLAGLDLTGTAHTNAGDYAADSWTFTDGTGNYNNASGTVHDTIAKANAIISVTPYNVTYDGSAHTATGTVTGAKGEALTGLDLSSTSHTNAGDYLADGWTFTDVTGNYANATGSVHDVIGKATATVTLADLSQTYNATPRPVSATTTPSGLTVVFTYDGAPTAPTNAGSYAIVGTINDVNYAGSNSGTLVIGKANATCSISGYTGVYDAAAHGASGSCSGISEAAGTLDLGATFANVPGGSAHWTFTGNGNYNDASGDVAITISPADATCTVSGFTGPYDGTAHGATGSCSGVGSVDLSAYLSLGETFTNVPGGTANWSFGGNNNYHTQNGTADIVLSAIDATCSITGYTGVYDAQAHGASGSCTGIGTDVVGTLDLGQTFKDVPGGTAHWTLTANGNYKNANGDASVVISKTDATCTINGYTGTYNAAPHGASGSCSGIGAEPAGTLDLGASFTNVPGGSASWTFTGNGNYNNQNGSAPITISAATPTVQVTGGTFTFDGNPHAATAIAKGISNVTVPGSFAFTYDGTSSTAPSAVGSHDVTASFTSSDTNYGNASGSCTGCLVISPANQPPSFTSTPVTAASVGTLYTYNVTTADPEANARTIFSVTTLPGWLTLTDHGNGTATLTGTPAVTDMGSHVITLRVSDGTTPVDQVFTLNPSRTVTLKSARAYDGWILETGEFGGRGGTMNAAATTFILGDDAGNRQYRSILSFNTSGLTTNATISQITLKIKVSGKPVGANPFLSLGNIAVDIKRGTFGLPALQLGDFQLSVGTAGKIGAMLIKNPPVSGWYSVTLAGTSANPLINKTGTTQFRLRFSKDDNNNHIANYLMFFSGNAIAANQPVLTITYQLP